MNTIATALAQPDESEWDDEEFNNAEWDESENWDNGVPDDTIAALHTMHLSDIQVNIEDAECDSFEGKGGSAADRFMVLLAGRVLTSDNDVFGTSGQDNFVIKLQDGSSGDETKIVAANLLRLDLVAASGHDADFFNLNVSGNVNVGTNIDVGDDAKIDIGGFVEDGSLTVGHSGNVDIVGHLRNTTVTLGASSIGPGDTSTTVTLGSVGGISSTNADWTLLGAVDVEVDDSGTGNGDFMVNANAQPTIHLKGDSTLTIDGDAEDGTWIVQDSATLDVGGGSSSNHFEPQELTVDGASVDAPTVGKTDAAWDLTIKNGGEMELPTSPLNLLGTGTDAAELSENSTLTFSGSNNSIHVEHIDFGGELVASGSGASLEVTWGDILYVSAELVRIVNDETVIIDFDAENVSLIAEDSDNPLDPSGPDYEGYIMLDGDDDPIQVLFTDSPCVRRWKKITYEDTMFDPEPVRVLEDHIAARRSPMPASDIVPTPRQAAASPRHSTSSTCRSTAAPYSTPTTSTSITRGPTRITGRFTAR